MDEIAAASNEQAQGIEQINIAMAGMNKVTQQNAASSEELASIMSIFKTGGRKKEQSVISQDRRLIK
jgi:methyl-accepting chemotaxis protein